jgi:hypothetical protein
MSHIRHRQTSKGLKEKYPPSEPCSCDVCLAYCSRPGWWTVSEAARAIKSGYASRMMLEVSPEQTFGVIAPAFKGCEGFFAINEFANNGCTFFEKNLCLLHETELLPLECAFCHHTRKGQGLECHADIEREWNTENGQALVARWMKSTGLWKMRHLCQIQWQE